MYMIIKLCIRLWAPCVWQHVVCMRVMENVRLREPQSLDFDCLWWPILIPSFWTLDGLRWDHVAGEWPPSAGPAVAQITVSSVKFCPFSCSVYFMLSNSVHILLKICFNACYPFWDYFMFLLLLFFKLLNLSRCFTLKLDTDVCDWFLFLPINQSQTSRLYHNDISEESAAPIFSVEVCFCSEHEGSYVPCNVCVGTPFTKLHGIQKVRNCVVYCHMDLVSCILPNTWCVIM